MSRANQTLGTNSPANMFADTQLHAAQPAKNGRQAPLTQDGESWHIKLPGVYQTSFNASAYQDPDANRVTLSIIADEQLQQIAKQLDDHLLKRELFEAEGVLSHCAARIVLKRRYTSPGFVGQTCSTQSTYWPERLRAGM